MRINPAKFVLSTLCLLVVVFGLFRVSILSSPLDEKSFLDALGAQREEAASFSNLRDISVYRFRVPDCSFDIILYISNFASKNAFDELSDRLAGRIQRFYLGNQISSFASPVLWPRYFMHQIASKMGLSSDTAWDQKLVVVQIDPACKSSHFQWDRINTPRMQMSSIGHQQF